MTNTLIETERLVLRPFKMGDEEAVLRFCSHPEVQRLTGDRLRTTIKEAKDLITDVWLQDYEKYGYGRFAVIDKASQELIGFNGIKYHPHMKETDLGYRFLPEFWGKGIATESSQAIIAHAFENFSLSKILGFTML
jgi:[ribosomal protein S5]-alanine N-acetyltransferase